jgi:hypothetical protein
MMAEFIFYIVAFVVIGNIITLAVGLSVFFGILVYLKIANIIALYRGKACLYF